MTAYLYKILTGGYKSPMQKSIYKPYLPKNGQPGPWTPYVPGPDLCEQGWHLVYPKGVSGWMDNEHDNRLFLAQAAGATVGDGEKIAANSIRLIAEIEFTLAELQAIVEGDLRSEINKVVALVKSHKSPAANLVRAAVDFMLLNDVEDEAAFEGVVIEAVAKLPAQDRRAVKAAASKIFKILKENPHESSDKDSLYEFCGYDKNIARFLSALEKKSRAVYSKYTTVLAKTPCDISGLKICPGYVDDRS